jgi:hypothetical protein
MAFLQRRAEGFFVANTPSVEESVMMASDLMRMEMENSRFRNALTILEAKVTRGYPYHRYYTSRRADFLRNGFFVEPYTQVLLYKEGLAVSAHTTVFAVDRESWWAKNAKEWNISES